MKKLNSNTFSPPKQIILSAIAIILGLVVVELFSFLAFLAKGEVEGEKAFHPLFRSNNDIYEESRFIYDPFLAYRYKPNSLYDSLTINEHGFIDNGGSFPDLMQKPDGVVRIFVLGGSSLAGSGASSNAMTIPAQMEMMLNNEGDIRYEVINAGVDGYFSYNEHGYALSDLIHYHPDIFLFYDGWNDYAYPVWAGGYLDEYQRNHARANNHKYTLYLLFTFLGKPGVVISYGSWWQKFYTTSLIHRGMVKLGVIGYTLQDRSDIYNIPGKVMLQPKAAEDLYLNNVRSSIGATRSHWIKVVYVLQPTILDKKNLTEVENDFFKVRPALISEVSNPKAIRNYYDCAREGFKRIKKDVQDNRVLVADLSNCMWEDVAETVYFDEIHTNDRGNQIIATQLVKLLKQVLKNENNSSPNTIAYDIVRSKMPIKFTFFQTR